MNSKYQYFLTVAEELNIGRAAERLFISYQGVSNAIRQLESEFGVILFNRSPKFTLTPEGETMVATLRQIKLLENNLESQLHANDWSYHGRFQVGITSSNYDALVPDIVTGFVKKYPSISLEIESDFSANLEQKLLRGDLELYIGVGHIITDITRMIPLITESYFFVCSVKILKEQFGEAFASRVKRLCEGCDLRDIDRFPVIYYPDSDKLQQSIHACALAAQVTLRKVFECKDANVIVKLAAKNLGGGIVTDFAIPTIRLYNDYAEAENYLYLFPLQDFITDCDKISLIHHPNKYLSRHHLDFIDLLCGITSNFKPEVQKMVFENNARPPPPRQTHE